MPSSLPASICFWNRITACPRCLALHQATDLAPGGPCSWPRRRNKLLQIPANSRPPPKHTIPHTSPSSPSPFASPHHNPTPASRCRMAASTSLATTMTLACTTMHHCFPSTVEPEVAGGDAEDRDDPNIEVRVVPVSSFVASIVHPNSFLLSHAGRGWRCPRPRRRGAARGGTRGLPHRGGARRGGRVPQRQRGCRGWWRRREDVSKTAFRCPGFVDLFEWVVMTFDLKNAGATYQRAMNLIFPGL